jgi:hypothetical protein
VLEHGLAVLGVQHLGVELHAGHPPIRVLERRHLGAGRARGDHEALGGVRDRVTVAHPHRLARREAVEERRVRGGDRERGPPELGQPGALHLAAEGERHGLEAVADPEGRHARLEQGPVHGRGPVRVHGGRTAGEDDRHRPPGEHLRDRHAVRDDLAVDVRLADAPRDELGVLRPEVHDEDRAVHRTAHESATTSAFWKSFSDS